MSRSSWNKHSESKRQNLPDAAAVYCLQGKLYYAYQDANKAIECYAEALRLNPFMWDAFLALCDLGVNLRIANIFKMTPEMMSSSGEEASSGLHIDELPMSQAVSGLQLGSNIPPNSDPFSVSTNRVNGDGRSNAKKAALYEKFNGSTTQLGSFDEGDGLNSEELNTPVGAGDGNINVQTSWMKGPKTRGRVMDLPMVAEPPPAPARKARALAGSGMDFGTDAPPRLKSSIFSRSKSKNAESDDAESTISISSFLTAGITDRKRTVSGQASHVASSNANPNTTSTDSITTQRRSARLNSIRPQNSKASVSSSSIGVKEGREIKKAKATSSKGRTTHGSTIGRIVSDNRKPGDPMDIDGKEVRANIMAGSSTQIVKLTGNERAKELESLDSLLELFAKLGGGYLALSHYQCQEALQIFSSIIQSQRETPWVLAQIGRTYYEEASYAEAEKYYARAKIMAPSRLDDIEIYSTILWHLQSEIELAFLARETVDIDRLSPQAWCAVGNSFSLQREHEQALKAFKRATQLDPKFAYAFTLEGHEHVLNEEYEKAMAAFRSAISAENRHYNAWYGLGNVYEKQGKFNIAEQHYRTAASINPTNGVLFFKIGSVLEKMRNPKSALVQYVRSCELSPRNTLARFSKARVLMTLQLPEQALEELKLLKDISPDDPKIHFWLGKVYKHLRQKGNALKHFTTALNLDPKVCLPIASRYSTG